MDREVLSTIKASVEERDPVTTKRYVAHVMNPRQIKDPEWEISVWAYLSPYKTGHREILRWSDRGDPDARRVAAKLLEEPLNEVGPRGLPDPLRSYAMKALAGQLPRVNRRGRRFKNLARDFWIWTAVWLCMRRKFTRTSNSLKRNIVLNSASQLVSQLLAEHGLHLSPARVEQIAKKLPSLASA